MIKVLLVYSPNYYFCFPPGLYYKVLVFDLILKRDVEIYQTEVMTKSLENVVERRRHYNVTMRRGGDVQKRS